MDNGCLRYSRFSPDVYFEGVSLLVITSLRFIVFSSLLASLINISSLHPAVTLHSLWLSYVSCKSSLSSLFGASIVSSTNSFLLNQIDTPSALHRLTLAQCVIHTPPLMALLLQPSEGRSYSSHHA